jgi:tetratricopeptide (TPR) repeat protein
LPCNIEVQISIIYPVRGVSVEEIRQKRREERKEMQIAELKQECEYVEYGNTCDSQGDFEGAVAAYDRALSIFPEDADAIFNKGETLVKMGEPTAATACFARAMALYAGA